MLFKFYPESKLVLIKLLSSTWSFPGFGTRLTPILFFSEAESNGLDRVGWKVEAWKKNVEHIQNSSQRIKSFVKLPKLLVSISDLLKGISSTWGDLFTIKWSPETEAKSIFRKENIWNNEKIFRDSLHLIPALNQAEVHRDWNLRYSPSDYSHLE